MTIDEAKKVLTNRIKAIDLHYERFPNTLDRTMEETATAMKTLLGELDETDWLYR